MKSLLDASRVCMYALYCHQIKDLNKLKYNKSKVNKSKENSDKQNNKDTSKILNTSTEQR